jgi:hypothetical protein
MTAYFTMDRYFPAFMQHIHAGYTPEDAVFHAELDYNADRVEETTKPAPAPKPKEKAKEKAKPASSSDASSTRPTPSSRKPHRKKSGGNQGQGELPL